MSDTPIFPKTLHQIRPNSETAVPKAKLPKKGSAGSQSRDTREDRGTRQMKASHNPQTMPHKG